jgi:succinate dehydrogenase / fumarate reductase, cytochrome b subunit
MSANREYFNRKLHSLLGVIPVGVYLTFHLVMNHFATRGEEAFNSVVGVIGDLPFLIFLEIFVIYLPMLYHAIYGLYIAFTAKSNLNNFGHFRNWMFILQRITGVIILIFVAWHVWETRIAAAFGAEVNFQMMENIVSNPFVLGFYILGIVSAVFHFANGLWSFFVSWGITVTPRSQQISTYVTMAFFIILSIIGVRAILAFV